MNLLTNTLKLHSLQNALSNRNDYADQPCTPRCKAHRDRQERREFSGSRQFRQSSQSCSPHRIGSSKFFSRCRASLLPYYQSTSLSHSPSTSPFFSPAQTPKVLRSVLYVWDKISAKSANAVQRTSEMVPRPGVKKKSGETHYPNWHHPVP
jgi:hypothetical protein